MQLEEAHLWCQTIRFGPSALRFLRGKASLSLASSFRDLHKLGPKAAPKWIHMQVRRSPVMPLRPVAPVGPELPS